MRESHGRAVAVLVGQFRDFDLAEEAVQDSWMDALRTWDRDGPPDNPVAWIVATARRRAIDRLRRRQRHDRLATSVGDELLSDPTPDPNTYPARIGRDRNSDTNPRRKTQPRTHQPPTSNATMAVSSTGSPPADTSGATVAAAMSATVDSAPMFRSRHVPNNAYKANAPRAVYRPCTDGTPARVAYANDCGTTIAQAVMAALESAKGDVRNPVLMLSKPGSRRWIPFGAGGSR